MKMASNQLSNHSTILLISLAINERAVEKHASLGYNIVGEQEAHTVINEMFILLE